MIFPLEKLKILTLFWIFYFLLLFIFIYFIYLNYYKTPILSLLLFSEYNFQIMNIVSNYQKPIKKTIKDKLQIGLLPT